jgi:hypothetical protein
VCVCGEGGGTKAMIGTANVQQCLVLCSVSCVVLTCVWRKGEDRQLGLGAVVIVIVCCACNDGTQKYMLDY